MNARQSITVGLGERSYRIEIVPGALDNQLGALVRPLSAGKVPIVADANTHRLFCDRIDAGLRASDCRPEWFIVEPGESAKSWSVLEKLTDWLLALGVARSHTVVALGGGVIGDLAGFACAITKRGCAFVQVPTTLLSQVDSSVGGKTAINTSVGKNLIGAFHQPSSVLIDPLVLSTLPEREMRAGFAEVLKYGLLGDAAFFDWLEQHGSKVLSREAEPLAHAIATSIRAKARIVEEDERETSGTRALLNLGHTFGHALEAETGFSQSLLHGEAVALGMVLAARYSALRGELSQHDAERIARVTANAGLPAEISAIGIQCDGQRLVDHMRHDKKMEGNSLPFVLLRGIGTAYLARDVDLASVAAFLDGQLG